MTLSEENHLKAIFHLYNEKKEEVNTNAIAEVMNTKASSVTDMLKRLADKGLINYVKYQGVTLTKKGTQKAIAIIRKHRLWEVFLVEKLNFSWDEVHEIAEELEHIQSEKLIERLDAFLDFPKKDPHGDPIPNKEGVFTTTIQTLLSELKQGDKGICAAVKNTSKEFLVYLNKMNIALGDEIEVLSKEPFDDSMTLLVNDKQINLSAMVCRNIYVMEILKKMNTIVQYIKDKQGKDILAVIPIEQYNQMLYNEADIESVYEISEKQKEILAQDLKELEEDILTGNEANNFSWEDIQKEVKLRYGY